MIQRYHERYKFDEDAQEWMFDRYTKNVYNMEGVLMRQKVLLRKLKRNGFVFLRHGGKHDIYARGADIEKIPRYNEINEQLAKSILRKWGIEE